MSDDKPGDLEYAIERMSTPDGAKIKRLKNVYVKQGGKWVEGLILKQEVVSGDYLLVHKIFPSISLDVIVVAVPPEAYDVETYSGKFHSPFADGDERKLTMGTAEPPD